MAMSVPMSQEGRANGDKKNSFVIYPTRNHHLSQELECGSLDNFTLKFKRDYDNCTTLALLDRSIYRSLLDRHVDRESTAV